MNMRADLVSLFCDLVIIPSESGSERNFLEYIGKILQREFGAECVFDSFGNLISKVPGRNSIITTPLLFGMHADTVAPGVGVHPVIDDDIIKSNGNTILGADDKAGIAELIIALRSAERFPSLEIILTREEERGLLGSKNLDYSLISARKGFVLDMDDINSIVIGGPSKINLDIVVHGKAAHAGMEPEKGISAIRAAALAISSLPDGRIDSGTTCNIGSIHGGENRNSVPEQASLQIEVRSLDHKKALKLKDLFLNTFNEAAKSLGASVTADSSLSYRAATMAPDSPVVLVAKAALIKVGLIPICKTIVGGTDASAYNEHGISCAVLGIGARKEHTKEEFIHISEMEKCVAIIDAILEHYATNL